MNGTPINWGAILAIVAIVELLWSVVLTIVVYLFVAPLRGATQKIDHLEETISKLNLENIQKNIDDHEERVRDLEKDAVKEEGFRRYVDTAERDRRLMNKKLDILLQRTAHMRKPEDERELSDES